jgi:8-oxo-dGTP diphosphatase
MGKLDQWKYCPRCREELERRDGSVECPACGLYAHANSEPTSGAVCLGDDGRMLLVRRAGEPYKGYWDLPGGFLEEGEHPLEGIRRELREETSLEVEPEDFIGVWIDRYGSEPDSPYTLNLYWTARVVSGEPEAADDVSEVAWFATDELPPDGEFAFHIAEVLAVWRKKHA